LTGGSITFALHNKQEKKITSYKIAVIEKEQSRLHTDFVALQETRLNGSGSIREKNFLPLAGKTSGGTP
jgi:hypothetical protein